MNINSLRTVFEQPKAQLLNIKDKLYDKVLGNSNTSTLAKIGCIVLPIFIVIGTLVLVWKKRNSNNTQANQTHQNTRGNPHLPNSSSIPTNVVRSSSCSSSDTDPTPQILTPLQQANKLVAEGSLDAAIKLVKNSESIREADKKWFFDELINGYIDEDGFDKALFVLQNITFSPDLKDSFYRRIAEKRIAENNWVAVSKTLVFVEDKSRRISLYKSLIIAMHVNNVDMMIFLRALTSLIENCFAGNKRTIDLLRWNSFIVYVGNTLLERIREECKSKALGEVLDEIINDLTSPAYMASMENQFLSAGRAHHVKENTNTPASSSSPVKKRRTPKNRAYLHLQQIEKIKSKILERSRKAETSKTATGVVSKPTTEWIKWILRVLENQTFQPYVMLKVEKMQSKAIKQNQCQRLLDRFNPEKCKHHLAKKITALLRVTKKMIDENLI